MNYLKPTALFVALSSAALVAHAAPSSSSNQELAQRQGQLDVLKQGINMNSEANRIYGLAKAQCWTNFAKHEWERNDRSNVVREALNEADILLKALADKQPISNETRLVDNASKLRQDLWNQAAALKTQPGYRCAAAATACAEVELVQAGHNFNQLGWRYANPYVGIAQDMLDYAKQEEVKCRPAPVVAPLAVVTPPPAPPKPVVIPQAQRITLQASALFKFDKFSQTDLLVEGKAQMDDAIAKLKTFKNVISIKLVGHTDRLGTDAYNFPLALNRANTVKAYFAAGGIDASKISVASEASNVPVKQCDDFAQDKKGRKVKQSRKAVQDCLQPNRRVEITFVAEQ